MAVKDGEDRISQSIKSLLDQSFKDFELIIINDGSIDRTLEIINSFQDPRIQVYSQINRGVAISANRGLALARGKYIARQDHDDISMPDRLEKQVKFLEANSNIYLLGTAAEIWSKSGKTSRSHDHPIEPKTLALELLFDNPFVHSSIMFRRDIVKVIGYYNPSQKITPLDDYDFISRCALKFNVANLSERLVQYYESGGSLTSNFRSEEGVKDFDLKQKKSRIMARNICSILDIQKFDESITFFAKLYSKTPSLKGSKFSLNEMQKILLVIFEKINNGSDLGKLLPLFQIKLDHLVFCWYVNPKAASTIDTLRYESGKRFIYTRKFIGEWTFDNYVDARDSFMRRGSVVKKFLLKMVAKK
jgi:glycosyltransferase involved in cell wall biosynthesis